MTNEVGPPKVKVGRDPRVGKRNRCLGHALQSSAARESGSDTIPAGRIQAAFRSRSE